MTSGIKIILKTKILKASMITSENSNDKKTVKTL
jgi:hypothetical protein